MSADNRVVLFINHSDSRCGACGGNAAPNESAHLNEQMAGEGCGAVYTHLGSNYRGAGIEQAAQRMRPDLEWTDEILAPPYLRAAAREFLGGTP